MRYCYCSNFDFGTVYVYLVQSPSIVADDRMASDADAGVIELTKLTYYRIWSTTALIVIRWSLPLSRMYIVYFVESLVYVCGDSVDGCFGTRACCSVAGNCCCWRCCCCRRMNCSYSSAVT